jgi:hypothetical protein
MKLADYKEMNKLIWRNSDIFLIKFKNDTKRENTES